MRIKVLTWCFLLGCCGVVAQEYKVDRLKVKEDLDKIVSDLSDYYVYLHDKQVDLKCIQGEYEQQIPSLKTEEDVVLFFEYLLDEFYDSHLILNTNRNSSFRLSAPLYAKMVDGSAIVSSVWQNEIAGLDQNIIGAELLKINGIDIDTVIEEFPARCQDKSDQRTREWVLNKVIAGRYNQPRVLTLKAASKKTIVLDLDELRVKSNAELLTASIAKGVGVIRINNSLGNNDLIAAFDHVLDTLMNTKGLIIDLRNTVDGGNSYVARGIMGRFIKESRPYQKHAYVEQYDDAPMVKRSWVEYVSPRGKQYTKPVVILVGRWTGSMGEGTAIGFEGMGRAEVVGTEMERLAGEMEGFSFSHRSFQYRLSTAKLFHVNGTPRERYIPTHYVTQTTIKKDEVLAEGLKLIKDLPTIHKSEK